MVSRGIRQEHFDAVLSCFSRPGCDRSYVFKSEVHMNASGDRGETAMAADDVRDGEIW
jgi:hypothetical protein